MADDVFARGYTKGNVLVVSRLANQMKSCATLDQMRMLVAFYEGVL